MRFYGHPKKKVGHIEMFTLITKTEIVNIVLYHSKMITIFFHLFRKQKKCNRYL